MEDLNDKVTGGNVAASEWNQIPSELQNLIVSMGLTLTAGNLSQLGQAIATYISNGNYYVDSGTANAFVLTPVGPIVGPPSRQNPVSYVNGMTVEFISGSVNTGSCTANASQLGAKSIVNTAQGGEFRTGVRYVLKYRSGTDDFINISTVGLEVRESVANMVADLDLGITDVVLTLEDVVGGGDGAYYSIDTAGGGITLDNGLIANLLETRMRAYTTLRRILLGENAGASLSAGADGIIALGGGALENFTIGGFSEENIAIGDQALNGCLTARDMLAIGFDAAPLAQDVGDFGGVMAIGNRALELATDVYQTTAVGNEALGNLVNGQFNQAFGWGAGQRTALDQNTCVGLLALGAGPNNEHGVAVGFFAGVNAEWSSGLTLVGFNTGINLASLATALPSANGGASGVTLIGNEAGSAILSGDNITALGSGAMRTVAVDKTGSNNTSIGAQSGQTNLVTVSDCTLLGAGADVKNDVDDGQVVITRGDGSIVIYDDGFGNLHLTRSSTRGGGYNIGGFGESFLAVTATSSFVIPVPIPDGARILGCQIRVDQALATGDEWDAAYSGGATQSIATNQALVVDTKVNKHFNPNAASDITSAVANITITRNAGGNFTAQGLIRAFVYYQTFTDLDDT